MHIIKKYILGLLLLALFIFAVFLIYKKLNHKQIPPDLIVGTGRIDGDLININTKYAGRIEKLLVEESQEVKKGQLLAVLSNKEYKAKLKAINAQINAKKEQLKANQVELEITKESLPENVEKAKSSLQANKAALSELEESIKSMEKVVEQDKKDYERFKNLAEKDLFPYEKFEKIKLKYETDKNKLEGLYQKRKQILASIKAAESTLKQAKSTLKKVKAIDLSILALNNSIKALQAQKEEIETVLEELKIKSPVDGYIVDKIANEGEVIAPGMPVFTAINPADLYLKMFVDTIENGKIKIGDKAEIFLDSYPDKPIPAKVVKIAKKAEFTPKEVAVKEDRIQRVYAVYLKPINPNPLLKLGLPAIGVISLDGENLPASLKEIPEI